MIDETMKTRTYDESDVVQRVLEARLTHLANRFWRRNDEQLLFSGMQLGLDDLIMELKKWISILSNRDEDCCNFKDSCSSGDIGSATSGNVVCAAAHVVSTEATANLRLRHLRRRA